MPKRAKDAVVLDGVQHDIDCHDKPVEVIVLADLHIGDPQCDVRLVQSLVDSVRDNPNRYCIIAGDVMNNALANSKSDVYTATMKPSDQLRYATKLFEPIKDKILCIIEGNHEERTSRTAGFDLMLCLAAELGISRVYQESAGLVFLKFGRNDHGNKQYYSIYVNHGRGGGRKVGGKMNALSEYSNIIDADVYVVGHTHLPATYKDCAYRIAPQRGQATLRERLYVNTASCLLHGGYSKRQGYQPASNSYPIITLDDKRHYMTATV